MGNLELHLIKGVPNAPSGRDLIVSHIALDTNEPHKVLEKLLSTRCRFGKIFQCLISEGQRELGGSF